MDMRLWLACLLHKTGLYRLSGAGPISHTPSLEISWNTLGTTLLDAGHPGGPSDLILSSCKAANPAGPWPSKNRMLPVPLAPTLDGYGILKSPGLITR